MREPGEHPSYDFAKLMNTAKGWGIFDGDRMAEASSDWHVWIAAESKKRSFTLELYLILGLLSFSGSWIVD